MRAIHTKTSQTEVNENEFLRHCARASTRKCRASAAQGPNRGQRNIGQPPYVPWCFSSVTLGWPSSFPWYGVMFQWLTSVRRVFRGFVSSSRSRRDERRVVGAILVINGEEIQGISARRPTNCSGDCDAKRISGKFGDPVMPSGKTSPRTSRTGAVPRLGGKTGCSYLFER